ncbi:MAG TPA: hypothetical protein VFS49_02880 [Croceibacterium sp.]|nr:hypothetical protein [Croceibacterium sp.]
MRDEQLFHAELARVRGSGVLGDSGRLRELFDYLAARAADAPPASQADIADSVFGQADTEGDDATVRVYVHRLRKRLDEFYASAGEGTEQARLTLPAGTYALRLTGQTQPAAAQAPAPAVHRTRWAIGLALLATLVAAVLLGRALPDPDDAPPANAFWQPFLESDRPTVVVVGDYYLFGEIDPVEPEQSRLIRDYRVNSPTDLAGLQDAEPERYGNAEDVGLTYLPLATAAGLREVMPILARRGRNVSVIAASELHADTIRDANIVYIGLIGALGSLEDTVFEGAGFAVGESYDELVDKAARKSYVSDEARRLAAPVFYRDYGYVARFRAPGGSLVAVVAGARETALRGVAPIMSGPDLPAEVDDLARGDGGMEALFQVTGQQGADLSDRLLVARARR